MTERERVKAAMVEGARQVGVRLECICNPRSPGWWVDLTCADSATKDLATRWERFVRTLPSVTAAIGYRLCDLRTECRARPYATFALQRVAIDRVLAGFANSQLPAFSRVF